MAISSFMIGTIIHPFGIIQNKDSVIQTIIVNFCHFIFILQEQLPFCTSPHKFFFPKTGIWSKDLYSTGPVRM